ncbi:unnamed protein product [Penicillium manginii]
MARLSGLQREVLSLYRSCLREIRNKPADSHNNFKRYARYVFYLVFLIPSPLTLSCSTLPPPSFPVAPLGLSRLDSKRFSAEFQKHLSVNKKDFSTVEYLLRKGHRQLEMYASPGIRNIS